MRLLNTAGGSVYAITSDNEPHIIILWSTRRWVRVFEVVIAHNTHYNILYCPRNLQSNTLYIHNIYVCVCVYMEIAAHMVLPCHYEKKNKKKLQRTSRLKSVNAYCTIIIIVVYYMYYNIIVFVSLSLSLSLSLSPIRTISFRDLVFCFAIAKPVVP